MTAVATTAPLRTRRGPVRRAANILTTVLLVCAGAALLAMTVGPRIFHYRTATMLTGSMTPTIDPGDVIVDTQENATDIKVGQIITYHVPVADHRVESHRVVWVGRARGGAVLFRTKGDANNGPDPWTAQAKGDSVWRVRAVLPLVGTVIRFLRIPIVSLLLTRVLPALVVGWLLVSIWRRPRPEQ